VASSPTDRDVVTPSPLALAPGLSREFLLHHRLCPQTETADGFLVVAATPDAQLSGIDEIAFAYRQPVVVEEASFEEVERGIEHLVARSERSIEISRLDLLDELTADVRDLANQPPVVRYVNLIVREAYDVGASDIHLETWRDGLRARLRVDGILVPGPEPPATLGPAIVSRIKLLAELDIAERRRPQDGRIRVRLEDRDLDVRVSTVPNLFGESVVLRLLDRGGRPVELEELGMPSDVLRQVAVCVARPHGLILVTGPTGSGKTTTLYAALARRRHGSEKVVTVEDPVEYELPGVVQVPVHAHAGVTFGSALRSILRQDPDVVMVGEMRDSETAEVAVQSALTGHLVLSTLHTNDALGAIPRMLDLGIPPFLVTATLNAVLAQRLVRCVCPDCAVTTESDTRASPRGCRRCRGTGYTGRTGIFELLVVDDTIRTAINAGAGHEAMRSLAVAGGMRTLRDDGMSKADRGITTVEEVLRVSQE
jgi:general secretion pathway protein E